MEKSAIKIRRPLGFPWETQDPFLFCVYHEDFFPKGNEQMGPDESLAGRSIGNDFVIKDGYRMYHGQTVPGFPAHPHRGFETVTIVEKGLVDHADSLGATGRFGNGDVQWMTAGKGVQHSEMFPLRHKDKENTSELFQIWLNLPKRSKFVEPHYHMLWHEDIPVVVEENTDGKKVRIKIVAGNYKDVKPLPTTPDSWAADVSNQVAIWKIVLEPGATWTLPAAAEGVNRTLYFFKGDEISLNGERITNHGAFHMHIEDDVEVKNGGEVTELLVLQGKPINEPVAQYGPFVMNTQEEIQQTISEYQRTEFGGWPWPRHDYVHPREKGRFAHHADGHEEIKD